MANNQIDTADARPFLKWAGGKTQLLDAIESRLPEPLRETSSIPRYVEPFVGGGAVFFYLQNRYDIGESILIDLNRELIVGYRVIQQDPEPLIEQLAALESHFIAMEQPERKTYFYKIRDRYNQQMLAFEYSHYNDEWVERAAYLIFLNKTCYNGLFRQNQQGEFNVPYGRYVNPTICDTENIRAVHRALQDTTLMCDTFTAAGAYIDDQTFVYFDPPYRPLNATSSFTGYFKEDFDDESQRQLADFFYRMDQRNAWLLLSNSDPQNEDEDDTFFYDLYKDFVIAIEKVPAKRSINSKGNKRGEINELLIRNYSLDDEE